nr:hypothetical protein [Saprospiraceae bacterium]
MYGNEILPIDCELLVNYPEFGNLDCEEVIVQEEINQLVWRNKDSDGVVLVESQMDIPQHTHDPVPLEGVTHMQVRNSSHTAEMLEIIFEGGVGDFFRTEVK